MRRDLMSVMQQKSSKNGVHFEDDNVVSILNEHGIGRNGIITQKDILNVTDIGTWFKGSSITSFDEFDLFTGVKTLNTSAFGDCKSLTSIKLPNFVTRLNQSVFENCVNLKLISLGSEINILSDKCFGNCSSLYEFSVPSKVTTIPAGCFYGCSSLVTIHLNNVKTLSNHTTAYYSGIFNGCSSLERVTGNYVNYVGDQVFKGCSKLHDFNFANIETINREAFNGCGSIVVNTLGKITILEVDALRGTQVTVTRFPDTLKSITGYRVFYSSSLEKINTNQVTTLNSNANLNFTYGGGTFTMCTKLKYANLPRVGNVIECCFYGCSELLSVKLANSVKTISRYAFGGCGKATIYLPDVPPTLAYVEAITIHNSIKFVVSSQSVKELYLSSYNNSTWSTYSESRFIVDETWSPSTTDWEDVFE